MAKPRRLSESEFEDILSRAVEIDTVEGTTTWDPSTVEEIGVAAGISVGAVRQAIAELGSEQSPPDSIVERSLLRHRETSFAAGYLSERDAAFLFRLLRRLGHLGRRVEYEGGQVKWVTPDHVEVRVTPRSGETHVSAESSIAGSVVKSGLLFIGGSVSWAIALAPILTGDLSPHFLMPALAGAAVGVTGWAAYWRQKLVSLRTRVRDLSEGIAATCCLLTGRHDKEEPAEHESNHDAHELDADD